MDFAALLSRPWTPPALPEHIPQGDMPGDRIHIGPAHVAKANVLLPALAPLLIPALTANPWGRAVVTVCGGSGVGKSEIASLLAFYLTALGIGSYTLSGDNYPRRRPPVNDQERLRVFREGGLQGLLAQGLYTRQRGEALRALWAQDADAAPQQEAWLEAYRAAGRAALAQYLGTDREIDFPQLTRLTAAFKGGAEGLYLRRMGREAGELWYDWVDMTSTRVLLIEWTHGNSDHYEGVDIPIFLHSTPAETLAYRRARNRDRGADSPFTAMVLDIEQGLLTAQAPKAALILSKGGELLSHQAYQRMVNRP